MNKNDLWKVVAIVEIVLASFVILFDLFIPTIIMIGMIIISLLLRRDGFSSLGFKKKTKASEMVAAILLFVVLWQLLHLGITKPILNHLTGTQQDLSAFQTLQGDIGSLLVYLALTWTLAAFGEEIVYRGYLQKRLGEIFGDRKSGLFLTVGISSILFGMAHTEQGSIGVVVTFLDAVFFSWLKLKYDNNLWASVLAHGFSNSIGLVAFFFAGPIYGFW
jgi:membrane protease YdiL (CAAX protease family)